MITEIKHYYCDNTPSDMDILEGMNIAKEKQCRVTIHWFAWGWEYTVTIDENSSLDEVKEQMPKVYGM
jgi:hypothetical protein